jgi:hypothetical protein
MASHTHLDHVRMTRLPEAGCEERLATEGRWLHAPVCLEWGKFRCCDDSPNRHVTAHARKQQPPAHPLARAGQTWSWCFADDFALVISDVRGETRIPLSAGLIEWPSR